MTISSAFKTALLAISVLFSFSALAADLPQLQSQKAKLNQSIAQAAKEIGQLKQSLADDKQSLAKAEVTLEKKSIDMTTLFEQAKTDASQTRRATLAAISYNREVDRVDRLRADIAEAQARISALNTETSKNKAALKRLQADIQAAQAAAKKSAHKPKVAAPAPKPKPVVKPKPVAKAKPVAKKAQQKAGTWLNLDQANEANRLFTLDAIERAKKNNKRPPLRTVKITGKTSFGTESMSYLGSNLYELSEEVKAGRHGFKIFNQQFWATIPAGDNGKLYHFVYDVNSLAAPKLYLFRADLLKP